MGAELSSQAALCGCQSVKPDVVEDDDDKLYVRRGGGTKAHTADVVLASTEPSNLQAPPKTSFGTAMSSSSSSSTERGAARGSAASETTTYATTALYKEQLEAAETKYEPSVAEPAPAPAEPSLTDVTLALSSAGPAAAAALASESAPEAQEQASESSEEPPAPVVLAATAPVAAAATATGVAEKVAQRQGDQEEQVQGGEEEESSRGLVAGGLAAVAAKLGFSSSGGGAEQQRLEEQQQQQQQEVEAEREVPASEAVLASTQPLEHVLAGEQEKAAAGGAYVAPAAAVVAAAAPTPEAPEGVAPSVPVAAVGGAAAAAAGAAETEQQRHEEAKWQSEEATQAHERPKEEAQKKVWYVEEMVPAPLQVDTAEDEEKQRALARRERTLKTFSRVMCGQGLEVTKHARNMASRTAKRVIKYSPEEGGVIYWDSHKLVGNRQSASVPIPLITNTSLVGKTVWVETRGRGKVGFETSKVEDAHVLLSSIDYLREDFEAPHA